MYDIIIIGGGPAGLSAAIAARARNKETLVISNAIKDNPLAASKLVDNYPGMPKATGLEILETMHEQAKALGAQFLQARAVSILPMKESFSVTTNSDFVESRALIIACGAASGGKPIKGEKEFLGRGVSYCATCDGMLYRSSTVLIAGLSEEAADEANFMAEIGATVNYVAKEVPAGIDERVQCFTGKLVSIEGDTMGVTHAVLAEGTGKEATETKLEVNGVFILRPGVAPTNMLSSLETEGGYIKIDANMHTNKEGVFAAGDCTGKPLQVAKAVGQGLHAALSAVEYLQKQ